jgi:hypothetical protein
MLNKIFGLYTGIFVLLFALFWIPLRDLLSLWIADSHSKYELVFNVIAGASMWIGIDLLVAAAMTIFIVIFIFPIVRFVKSSF